MAVASEGAQIAGADYPYQQPALEALPPLDIRQVSKISGIAVGTLNVQFARGIFPWVTADQQGRARRFDPNFAMHLAFTGVLMQLGFSSPTASVFAMEIMAAEDLSRRGLKAIIGPRPQLNRPGPYPLRVIRARTLSDVENALGDDELEAFIIIGVNRVMKRLIEVATKGGGKDR